ncbi:riboflavin biosynthesis protein RibF [Methylobacterium dankookense]|uniref:Riboflavin biosynthesis protein n=1 Tax=Methylobacterium dankookense TaxID=560405 RepID=A0A564FU40_9HYPH|nr:riboflavin biosynthesis protein RibF [Methylobacterium dankookense]GJD57147.1 Bifunctional riboflavin kinase/FMN adenylyltransferase [Methylobacterium dankookense]VUF11679.1 Riboflavin biosynthesis protein RibF [Methylobacterium dankookense]
MASGDETAGRPFTICRADEALPPRLRGGIAAIGNFDGVHRGHRVLAEAVRREAGDRPALVLTFEPHPRAFFAPDLPMFRLTGPRAKEIVFGRLGREGLLDGLMVRRFDAALAGTGARAFVEGLLRSDLGLSGVVIGHDFHFGRRREGTPAVLAELCREMGLSCRIVEPVTLADEAEPISSSGIRRALAGGAVGRANALLGYRWFVLGHVRHGDKRGRTLGYPTANVALADCDLAHGIYAVRVRLPDGAMRDGVASYGRRPTFDDGAPLLEVNLFDFAGDLYGQEIAVEFVAHIRGEERFASAEALVARMDVDAAESRRLLAADRTPSMLD